MTVRLSFLALLFVSFSAWAAEFRGLTANEWLDRMSRAFTEETYDGIFSYYSGADLATLRVVHGKVDGVVKERLVHLNGAPREFIRVGDEVACILQPGDVMLELESSIPAGPFARGFTRRFDQVSDTYKVGFHGLDRIATREAVRLSIMPQTDDRYGYRLWLDTRTGLLLRSELVDMHGEKLEIFQFATLTIGEEIPESALEPEMPEGSVVKHLKLTDDRARGSARADVTWAAAWVPIGFRMASWDVRRMPTTLKSVSTLMYSDGLAAFSIFIEKMPERGAAAIVSRNGATVAVTEAAEGPAGEDHLVTVVGEVPTTTAQRIAQSVEYQSP